MGIALGGSKKIFDTTCFFSDHSYHIRVICNFEVVRATDTPPVNRSQARWGVWRNQAQTSGLKLRKEKS